MRAGCRATQGALFSLAAIRSSRVATDAVLDVMRSSISPESYDKYMGQNINFMLWLYNNDELCEDILHDWMIEKLHAAKREDDSSDATKKSLTNQRKACKEAIDGIRKGDSSTFPLIIQRLTFNVFSHYLTTKKKKDGSYLSKSHYGSLRSSFVYLFTLCGESIDPKFEKDLSQFMSGMKRKSAKQKAESGESLDEGKKPMSFDVYKKMCEILYKGCGGEGKSDYLFAHAFLTLEWNLMARSDNCLNMHVSHVQWYEDSLLFFFGKSKTNPTGEKSNEPWHVYVNPHNPFICPVLALSKYLLSNTDIVKDGKHIAEIIT